MTSLIDVAQVAVPVTVFAVMMILIFCVQNIQWYFRPKSGYKITRAFYTVGAEFCAYVLDYELRCEYFLYFKEEPTPNDIFAEAMIKHGERKAIRSKDIMFSARVRDNTMGVD